MFHYIPTGKSFIKPWVYHVDIPNVFHTRSSCAGRCSAKSNVAPRRGKMTWHSSIIRGQPSWYQLTHAESTGQLRYSSWSLPALPADCWLNCWEFLGIIFEFSSIKRSWAHDSLHRRFFWVSHWDFHLYPISGSIIQVPSFPSHPANQSLVLRYLERDIFISYIISCSL